MTAPASITAQTSSIFARFPDHLHRLIFAVVTATAFVVLLFGWIFGYAPLTRIYPGGSVMVPSTASCFLLLAASLTAALPHPGHAAVPAFRALLRAVALCIAAIALIDLVVSFGGIATGVDALLFPHFAAPGAGSMSPATATCFLCAAICAFGLSLPDGIGDRAFTVSATFGLVICTIPLACYLVQPAALANVFFMAAMAFHTALLFALLFIGLMLANPNRGWIGLFFGDGIGSIGARRLVPLAILLPVLLTVAALAATRAGLIGMGFRSIFLSVAYIFMGVAGLLYNANAQNRSERRLKELFAELELANEEKSVLLAEVYHRVKNNLQQVDALLSTEARKHDAPEVRASFDAMSGRIRAVSTVHQLLIQRQNIATIELADFLRTLCDNIADAGGLASRNIALDLETDQDASTLSTATTLGLLVNEIVVNAIKHAFDGRESGRISVTYRIDAENGEDRILTVQDDGKGLDPSAWTGPHLMGGAGSMLINGLVNQLRGNIEVSSGNGARFVIRLPSSTLMENR